MMMILCDSLSSSNQIIISFVVLVFFNGCIILFLACRLGLDAIALLIDRRLNDGVALFQWFDGLF